MCLAIPGKIVAIEKKDTPETNIMADVSFAGIIKKVCLDFLPGVKTGEYVMVHVGFAISKVDEKDAEETLKILTEPENNRLK